MAVDWKQLTRRNYAKWELGVSDIFLDFRTVKSALDAVEERVEAVEGDYLPLAGGTMTGALDMGTYDLQNIGDVDGDDGLVIPFDGITEEARTSWCTNLRGTTATDGQTNSQVPHVEYVTGANNESLGTFYVPDAVFDHGNPLTATIDFMWWTGGTDTDNVEVQLRLFMVADGDTFSLGAKYNSSFALTPTGTANDIQKHSVTTGSLNWTNKDRWVSFRFNRRGTSESPVNSDSLFVMPQIRIRWNGNITG